MTYTRLILLAPRREQTSRYLIADLGGGIVTHGVLNPGAPPPQGQASDILIAPSEDILIRRLALPTGGIAQVRAAALAALEDQFGLDAASVHLALGAADETGARLVCAIDAVAMRALLHRAAELGCRPAAVYPDSLMLPEPAPGEAAVADLGDRVLARTPALAFAADPIVAGQVLGAGSRAEIGGVEGFEKQCAAGRAPVDLLQGAFASSGTRVRARDFRLAAVLAALLAVSPLVLWTAQIVRHDLGARSLERQANEAALAALSGERPVDPVRAVRARAAQLEGSRALLRATAALFAGIEQTAGAEVEALYYQQDGALRASLAHDNYSDPPAVASRLRQAGYEVQEDGAVDNPDGRITTALSVRARP